VSIAPVLSRYPAATFSQSRSLTTCIQECIPNTWKLAILSLSKRHGLATWQHSSNLCTSTTNRFWPSQPDTSRVSEDAKDIYQEVFIRVHRGLKHFKMQSEFATWLHRITVNVCLTHRARRHKHVHVSLDGDNGDDESGTNPGELTSRDEPTDQHAMNTETRQHVQEALDELSAQQRLVFTLKHYEGYKLREIALMMKCTEGTIKRYLFLATQQLRTRLKTVYE